jgi:excisionase family DNA binding protein
MEYDPPKMKPRLLSVRQAAQYLNISQRSVRRLIREGKIPHVMIRSLRMVPFNQIYGLPPTPVYHVETRILQIDLERIAFSGLPGPKRGCPCKKDRHGKFAPKYEWQKIENDARRGPIQTLIEDGVELPKWITHGK